MALALRAAFGVRVCNPANAVAKRYPEPSVFWLQQSTSRTLDSRFRGNDDDVVLPGFRGGNSQTKPLRDGEHQNGHSWL